MQLHDFFSWFPRRIFDDSLKQTLRSAWTNYSKLRHTFLKISCQHTHNRWTNYMQNCINKKQQKTRTSKTRKITVDQILTINQYKQFPSCCYCSGTGSIKHKTESEEHSAECIPLTVAELTCRNPLGMRSCWSPCHRLVTTTTSDVWHNGCYNIWPSLCVSSLSISPEHSNNHAPLHTLDKPSKSFAVGKIQLSHCKDPVPAHNSIQTLNFH